MKKILLSIAVSVGLLASAVAPSPAQATLLASCELNCPGSFWGSPYGYPYYGYGYDYNPYLLGQWDSRGYGYEKPFNLMPLYVSNVYNWSYAQPMGYSYLTQMGAATVNADQSFDASIPYLMNMGAFSTF